MLPKTRLFFVVTLLVVTLCGATPGGAQPAGGEVCGDGSTFTVDLPASGSTVGNASVTLPSGCRIYALFVSGYERNKNLDELTFYKLARVVMANNGYVHYAWWNNLLGEYMGPPLHNDTFTLPGVMGTVYTANPGGLVGVEAAGFAPASVINDVPKAVPEEDTQFQADARRMLIAIRARHPDAIIIVAGHSMGGDSVARLGASTPVDIDLLAPIDPVGNRTTPVGSVNVADRTYNWTRWRATQETFLGFRRADCVRNPSLPLVCRDFDPRPFFAEHHCTTSGSYMNAPVVPPSLAPGICPGPVAHAGVRRQFGPRVKRLYHRWQKEALFPFDFATDQFFRHHRPLNVVPSFAGPFNLQRAVLKNGPTEHDPNKTCSAGADPRDSSRLCNPGDGHGEIVGFRSPTPGQPNVGPIADNQPVAPLALRARNWPSPTAHASRRQRMVEMATADDSWEHRPLDPDLCMVSDEMITILGAILDASTPAPGDDVTAPTTTAAADPAANTHGWNNSDVEVALQAVDDEGGSGVEAVEFTLGGASSGGAATPGDTAAFTIDAEGVTTASYHARDRVGHEEAPSTLTVRVDRTPPTLAAMTDSIANPEGWHRNDVVVSFTGSDALSGLDAISDPIVLSSEGAGQEAVGTGTDRAGNESSARATVNIDKTAPSVTILSPAEGGVYLLRARSRTRYSCADTVSGIHSCLGSVPDMTRLDTGVVGPHTFSVHARDSADNETATVHAYSVRYLFLGFDDVKQWPAVNVTKPGRMMSVKYGLRDAYEQIFDASTFLSLKTYPVVCGGDLDVATSAPQAAAGRLKVTRRQVSNYTFDWNTEKSWTGCRVAELALRDGTTHRLLFRFK